MRNLGPPRRYPNSMPAKSATKTQKAEVISLDVIERRIVASRGHRVMIDRDLAILYGVETRTLNQAVKRNLDRFPPDFMFRLTPKEAAEQLPSRSQSVILKRGQNVKYLPYVFTEHGGGHVGERPEKRSRRTGQHSSGSRLRQDSTKARHARVTRQANGETRGQSRQARRRTPARIHDSSRDAGASHAAQAEDRIPDRRSLIIPGTYPGNRPSRNSRFRRPLFSGSRWQSR